MMRVLRWLAIAGVVMANTAFAQAPTGVIHVNVQAQVQERAVPLSGARITLKSAPGRTEDLLALPDNEADLLAYLLQLAAARGPQFGITGAGGDAFFRTLVPGRYTVNVQREGFDSQTEEITVAANQESHVSLALNRPASIAGRVRDVAGLPLSNAIVTASVSRIENNVRVLGEQRAVTATDSSGQFRLTYLGPGDYVIEVAAPGFRVFYPSALEPRNATAVSVRAGQDLEGIEIIVPR